jgi:predicted nucleotidyltransferase component of viral defense system
MKQLSRADARLLSDLRQADDRLQRLPEAMLEKDVFITEVTLEVASLADKDIGVVFCGGTSLSKAHGLIDRMSEDVDFKLHVKADGLTKNQRRSLLGDFRDRAVDKLKGLGYDVNPKEHVKSRDSNAYTQIIVPFVTQFSANAAIRPHVQIELNASSPRLMTHNCKIATIVLADRPIFSRSGELPCVDVSETAAEKLVGFTRRTAQFLAGKQRGEFDTALVRHLYDVHQLYTARAVDEEVVKRLAAEVIAQDAEQYKNQHPEYFADPSGETKKVLEQIQGDKRFAGWYDGFVHDMIYGEEKPAYNDVLRTFTRAAISGLGVKTS